MYMVNIYKHLCVGIEIKNFKQMKILLKKGLLKKIFRKSLSCFIYALLLL